MLDLLPASEIMLHRICLGEQVTVTNLSDSVKQLLNFDFVFINEEKLLKPTQIGISYQITRIFRFLPQDQSMN